MKNTVRANVIILLVITILIAGCAAQDTGDSPTTIRIGWQVAWATQGQLAQTLKHTNIMRFRC